MREITYAEAIVEALKEEMKANEKVIVLGEDVGKLGGIFGATKGLLSEFGKERVFDTPISEAGIVGAAVGASLIGLRPVAEIMYIDFITIAADQLVNHAAKLRYMSGGKLKVPIVVRTQGGTGRSNAAQHSQSLESWFSHIPGLIVVMPATPYDAKGLLKASIRNDNPVLFIENKSLYRNRGNVPEGDYVVPLGKADIKREGKDVTMVTYSLLVHRCLKVAEQLSQEGINAEVIDLRTLSPLDNSTITNSVKKTKRCLVVHEACKTYGVGAEIVSVIMEHAFDYLDAPVKRLCGLDIPVPYARNLEMLAIPREEQIYKEIKELM